MGNKRVDATIGSGSGSDSRLPDKVKAKDKAEEKAANLVVSKVSAAAMVGPFPSEKPVVKVLIVGPSWVSDIVLSHTLMQLLVELHHLNSTAELIIDILAPGWSIALYQRMPEVRKVIDMPLGHGKIGLGLRRQLGQSLRKEAYDRAIVLPNSFKSAIVPFSAQIPIRTGWRGEMRYALLNDLRVLDDHQYSKLVERFAALALKPNDALPDALPAPRLTHSAEQAIETAEKFNLSHTLGPIVAVAPRTLCGDDRPEKYQLSATAYAELISKLLGQGVHVWLFGTREQRSFAKDVVSAVSNSAEGARDASNAAQALLFKEPLINLAGMTTLNEVLDLMSFVCCTLTDDRGLMHASVGLGCTTVSVEFNKEDSMLFTLPTSNDRLTTLYDQSTDVIFNKVMEVVNNANLVSALETPLMATY